MSTRRVWESLFYLDSRGDERVGQVCRADRLVRLPRRGGGWVYYTAWREGGRWMAPAPARVGGHYTGPLWYVVNSGRSRPKGLDGLTTDEDGAMCASEDAC